MRIKKSTVILLVTSLLAIGWTLVYYELAGTAILNARQGKQSRYATAPLPADPEITLAPGTFSSLDISASGVQTVICHDNLFRIRMKKHLRKYVYLSHHDSTLILKVSSFVRSSSEDTILILVPGVLQKITIHKN
jgi:hypothetical protein